MKLGSTIKESPFTGTSYKVYRTILFHPVQVNLWAGDSPTAVRIRLRESARFLEVKPQKKPRNPYRNRKKPAGTEKPYRNFARYLAVYLEPWAGSVGVSEKFKDESASFYYSLNIPFDQKML